MSVYIDEIKKKISQIVRFPSYQQPAEHGMPFGAPAAEALTYFLSLAKNMGFETHNYDNYAGEVIFGEGEEFAVLAAYGAGAPWTTRDPPSSCCIALRRSKTMALCPHAR